MESIPLGGLRIVESLYMEGAKKAFRIDNTIYVSHAMWKLIKDAKEGEELEFVLGNIPVLYLGNYSEKFREMKRSFQWEERDV